MEKEEKGEYWYLAVCLSPRLLFRFPESRYKPEHRVVSRGKKKILRHVKIGRKLPSSNSKNESWLTCVWVCSCWRPTRVKWQYSGYKMYLKVLPGWRDSPRGDKMYLKVLPRWSGNPGEYKMYQLSGPRISAFSHSLIPEKWKMFESRHGKAANKKARNECFTFTQKSHGLSWKLFPLLSSEWKALLV